MNNRFKRMLLLAEEAKKSNDVFLFEDIEKKIVAGANELRRTAVNDFDRLEADEAIDSVYDLRSGRKANVFYTA